jgi:transcriptional regulator with PAS, ATPase and Fis domain/CHASE2 domain-containing sensor protein
MKKIFLIGLLGALVTLVVSLVAGDLFRSWELKTIDTLFAFRGEIETDPSLVMIDADDASAKEYGNWPWDRSIHVQILEFLKEADAAVVAYDILFAQPKDPGKDALLASTSLSLGNVVFPVAISLSDTNLLPKEKIPVPQELWEGHWAADEVKNLFFTGDVIFPFPDLIHKERLGHIATNRDMDGIVRRVPLIVRHQNKFIPSLAFQTVLNFLKVPHSNIQITDTSIIISGVALQGENTIRDLIIPVDSKGQMLINFAGKWENTFKHASFASILSAGKKDSKEGLEDLTGKIILIANTLSGSDMKSIPFERNFPGPGIHANIINTILTGNFLREPSSGFNVLMILLLSLATSRILASRQHLRKMGAVFILAGAYIFLGVLLFHWGVILELFLPIVAIITTSLFVSVYQSTTEKKISDALLIEKQNIELSITKVSKELAGKDDEQKRTLGLLNSLQQEMVEEKKQEETQYHQIHELQASLEAITKQKLKLQEEHDELEKRFCDMNTNSTVEPSSFIGELEKIRMECMEAGIVTQNRKVLETFLILKQFAPVPSPVLILGESGTGKELFARALHNLSQRKDKPFIAVNMGAIPKDLIESELFGHKRGGFTGAINDKKGKFVLADKGTIFLDEIGDTSLDAQVKLLRVLQEKEVQPIGGDAVIINTRVVAATHQKLERLIKDGGFREDLFYRLNALTVHLPPLRERQEDIPYLVQHFVQKYSTAYGKNLGGVSEQAMKTLVRHEWKGNIRELENIIQRGITLAQGDLVQEKDLGLVEENIPQKTLDKKPRARTGVDDELLLDSLRENKFEINETAVNLNMSRNTVSSRLKGICFELLVKNDLDRNKVAEEISRDDLDIKIIHQKVSEYHENLIKTVNGFNNESKAVNEVLKRSKNIPTQYHPAIRELVKRGYQQRES